ncbi:HpcH/HpaI aldolase/citrate lyase family protein [Deinococcus maricopensis]|uniref:Citryl-CoA lyase n=1 Tax=Deinococcus maricopensis (strain DSM 21211 / LMG 22137 / NRRL B-23946 / LB-34) TaxID=709986 RepID=E8UBQ4_DEIML|nr:CoA ester lyase [Deinococcus maricopensis]ADV68493.1 Citryl-CoA lyase [Deinococcus maricopensis DSM 21211]
MRARSALYVPADKPRALEKARTLPADLIILDLEDAVAEDRKAEARMNAVDALRVGAWRAPVLLRVNGLTSRHFDADFETALKCAPAGIVLPKAEDAASVRSLHLGLPLWLMIETPRGVLNADALAGVPGVAGLLAGANDLARDLRTRPHPDRWPLLHALSQVVLAARANGVVALDAVFNDVRDAAGFARECVQGRDLGFDGKTVIHPEQVRAANAAFGVSAQEAEAARALLATWAEARAAGLGVTTHAGQLIEELHARTAEETLARWTEEQVL